MDISADVKDIMGKKIKMDRSCNDEVLTGRSKQERFYLSSKSESWDSSVTYSKMTNTYCLKTRKYRGQEVTWTLKSLVAKELTKGQRGQVT